MKITCSRSPCTEQLITWRGWFRAIGARMPATAVAGFPAAPTRAMSMRITCTVQVLNDGAFRFVKPDGTGFNSVATGSTTPLGDWAQLPRRHRAEGVHIDRSTAVTRWRGEQMDYDIAVEALLARSRNVPAEAH